jgi:hypothetical protein
MDAVVATGTVIAMAAPAGAMVGRVIVMAALVTGARVIAT